MPPLLQLLHCKMYPHKISIIAFTKKKKATDCTVVRYLTEVYKTDDTTVI